MRTITKLAMCLALVLASGIPAAAQPYQVLAHFKPDAGSPRATLLLASDGYLYGTTIMGGDIGLGSVFRIHPNGTGFQTVASFVGEGSGPNAELIEVAGFLYGTAASGGGASSNQSGIIFRIDLASAGSPPAQIEVVHLFNYQDPANGGFPSGGLLESNGVLYGTSEGGGAHGAGTVFALDLSASPPTLSVLHSFTGERPVGTIVEANGQLYGMTERGGQANNGAMYRIDLITGGTFQIVVDFVGFFGLFPGAGLLQVGTDLYGTTVQGGNGDGTVFRFDTTTDAFEVIHFFDRASGGAFPAASLMQAANSKLYGTTQGGGASGHGAVFEVDLATDPPTVVTLHHFVANASGSWPVAGLVQAGALLYGTTSDRGPGSNGTVFSIDPSSGATSVIHAFGPTGPVGPVAEPIEVGGSLIGTSYQGGARRSGTVFKWDPATSNVTVLHSFDQEIDGAFPQAPVIRGSDGRLFGTTWIGGPTTCGVGCTTSFGGAVFRMDADGANFTILRSFTGTPPAPYSPFGRLLETGGFLYGVLAAGGTSEGGAVFRMDLNGGAFQILHEFDAGVDGAGPVAGLTLGTDGLLYGTTGNGGQFGEGTAFRMDTSGGNFEVLHAFDLSNPFDGAFPESGLVQVGPTLFMGTTRSGGLYSGGPNGGGTVYKLDVGTSPSTFTVVRSFEECCTSPYGSYPRATLAKGAGGWAYGLNNLGGQSFNGTIYAITTNGTIRVLHDFTFADGAGPVGGLTIAADGSLYGTTFYGGNNRGGVLFRFRLDSDGDNVLDPIDNCPTFANPSQADTDGDGIGDGCPVNVPQLPTARLTIGPLNFTYDGTPKIATVTVTPADAGATGVITVTYDGSSTPPTNAGTYTVVASLANPNYTSASVTAQMFIGRATPVITWNNPADISVLTPLSSTQLNATASVAGSFAYTPDVGTFLPAGNGQVLSVVFTPADQLTYFTVGASVTINVEGLTVLDTTPPVVIAPVDISVLATQDSGATGDAIYYPWVGVPVPTLAGFLASATATDNVSLPVQLPTELRNCNSGGVLDADVDASTVFPIGDVNCVRFSFRDAAGNVGHVIRRVTVRPGALAKAGTPVNALGPQGFPSGVTVEFDEVTAPGMVGATCSRNANSTAPADIRLDVRPTVTCGLNPDGTPMNCWGPAPPPPYTIDCDVSTTAEYNGSIKVCFLVTWGAHQVLHFNATLGQWEDVTIRPVSSTLPYICGTVSSLSPFVINTAPSLSLPPDVVAEAAGPSGAVVNYTVAATDPEEGSVPATCTPSSDSVFPLGTTVVSCSATDASGMTETGSFPVTVVDTTPPAVTAPAPITLNATESGGASASSSPALGEWLGGATAVDLVDPAPSGGAQVSPSTVFAVGTTTVTFQFVDKSGNSGTATSTVTVVRGSPQIAVTIAGRGTISATRQYVDLVFSNTGGGSALRATTLIIPAAVKGYGLVKVVSPGQPVAIGDLPPGATRTIRVVLNVPTTVRELLLIEAGAFRTSTGSLGFFTEHQTLMR